MLKRNLIVCSAAMILIYVLFELSQLNALVETTIRRHDYRAYQTVFLLLTFLVFYGLLQTKPGFFAGKLGVVYSALIGYAISMAAYFMKALFVEFGLQKLANTVDSIGDFFFVAEYMLFALGWLFAVAVWGVIKVAFLIQADNRASWRE